MKADDELDPVLRALAVAPPMRPRVAFRGTERYLVERKLGEGTFGVVHQALDRHTGGRVALKALRRPRADWLYRFKREFRALADFSHPNVVRLYELSQVGDEWFFTMELIEGEPFLAHVRPSVARLLPSLAQLARGIEALHAADIVHRDVKPSNVIIATDGRVVVLDFGLAEAARSDEGSVSAIGGTPLYMAPEQAEGRAVGPAADWYAVGVMLYEALTGRPPFDGTVEEILTAKRSVTPEPPPLVDGVPADLNALCMDLLQLAPERRPSGREVLERLARSRGNLAPVVAPPDSDGEGARADRFVGRAAELEGLHAAFAELRQRRAVVALLQGRSGMGKSALVARFVEQLRAGPEDAMILGGRCFEQESVPFKALDSVVDELAQQLSRMPRAEVSALLPRDTAALARLFPVLLHVAALADAPKQPAASDPLELRRRAFVALRELLTRLGERRRLVVVIDDLQWGDADSGALLGELLRPPSPPSLLLLAAFRSDGIEECECLRVLSPVLRAAAQDHALLLTELTIDRLSETEARAAALAMLSEDDVARAEEIARESQGWPFFIRQLARFFEERELGHASDGK